MTSTKHQIELLLRYVAEYKVEIAAAKAGMSYSTAKRYLSRKKKTERKPKVPSPRSWKTRKDAFADDWPTLKEMLERDHGLEAQTLMDWLLESYPNEFNPTKLEHSGGVSMIGAFWRDLSGEK